MRSKSGNGKATATPKKGPRLTLEEAAERVVGVLDRHLSHLPAKERARKLRKFYAGARTRGTRAT